MVITICAMVKTEGSEVPQNQTHGFLYHQTCTESLIILQTKTVVVYLCWTMVFGTW